MRDLLLTLPHFRKAMKNAHRGKVIPPRYLLKYRGGDLKTYLDSTAGNYLIHLSRPDAGKLRIHSSNDQDLRAFSRFAEDRFETRSEFWGEINSI